MARKGTPSELAILGLLYLNPDGGHGYDLARQFTDGSALAEILHLEPGMLYHHLKRLESSGFLHSTIEEQESRPARQRYQITSHGEARLFDWLKEPVTRTREIRLDFLVKLYFAGQIDPSIAADLVSEQLAVCRQIAVSLKDQIGQSSPEQGHYEVSFLIDVLQLRATQNDAAIVWLASFRDSLSSH